MIAAVRGAMRERLIEAADELFYAHGMRAVSVDRVIEHARTTKVTFYRHFKSKDDLVVAYLERRAAQERHGVDAAIAHGAADPDAALRLISDALGAITCAPGFRGCPFINAAAEYAEPDSAVRRIVDAHREWCRNAFARLVAPLDLPDPAAVAEDLMLLRDGAMVAGYLADPVRVAASFLRSCRAVIDGSRAPAGR